MWTRCDPHYLFFFCQNQSPLCFITNDCTNAISACVFHNFCYLLFALNRMFSRWQFTCCLGDFLHQKLWKNVVPLYLDKFSYYCSANNRAGNTTPSAVILLLLFLCAWAEHCLKQIWQGTQRRCLAGAGWSVVVTDTKIRARLTQSVFSMHCCLSDIHEQWNQRCFSQLLTEKEDSGTIRIHLDPIQHYLQFHALTNSFIFFPTHYSRFQVGC